MPHKQFPQCPLPKDVGEIWRYMDVYQLISILERGELYFSRADQFDDDWEGSLPTPRVEALRDEYEGIESKSGSDIFESSIRLYRMLPIRRFVNCWHINNTGSQLMWNNYGDGSIAIESTYEDLSESLGDVNRSEFSSGFEEMIGEPAEDGSHISIFEVEYRNFQEEDFADGTWGGEPIRFKREKYSQEQELRASFGVSLPDRQGLIENYESTSDEQVMEILGHHPGDDPTFEDYQEIVRNQFDKGAYVGVDVDQLINRIHLSPNAPGYAKMGVDFIVENSPISNVQIVEHDDNGGPEYA